MKQILQTLLGWIALNLKKYIIFSHLNINSIKNKFENLKIHVDILFIAETSRSLQGNL